MPIPTRTKPDSLRASGTDIFMAYYRCFLRHFKMTGREEAGRLPGVLQGAVGAYQFLISLPWESFMLPDTANMKSIRDHIQTGMRNT